MKRKSLGQENGQVMENLGSGPAIQGAKVKGVASYKEGGNHTITMNAAPIKIAET